MKNEGDASWQEDAIRILITQWAGRPEQTVRAYFVQNRCKFLLLKKAVPTY
jgi:hypothetical protein